MKILTAATAAMLIAQPLISTAFAGGTTDSGARREHMLRKLELLMPQQKSAPAAPVTGDRSAAVRVGGVIRRKTTLVGTIRCEANLAHVNPDAFTFYTETLSEPVTFVGNTGRCDITIPFKWQFADINGFVIVAVAVYTECSCTGTEVTRESDLEFPIIDIPAEGTTRFLGFTLDM